MLSTQEILKLGLQFQFNNIKIASIDLTHAEKHFIEWLNQGFYGEMHFLHLHGTKRYRPDELVPNTVSIITASMSYSDFESTNSKQILANSEKAYISRYALGRDYHKTFKQQLEFFAREINKKLNNLSYRVFVDSAPVMEVELASKSGLGWRGKHTLLISKEKGSNFFLGEIYTNLPLEPTESIQNHCGTCQKCMTVCPTQAIIQPYILDARRCISYLTIEFKGKIPIELRSKIGNRIYGCDDCQLFCPWNRFASKDFHTDFHTRHQLDSIDLIQIFQWNKSDFDKKCAGMAIYRIGYDQLIRNCAIALGNIKNQKSSNILQILLLKKSDFNLSENTLEHIQWAIEQHS